MKKITKKRVFIIFFSIIISIAVYIGQNTQSNGRNERNIGDAVQVTSLPVSGKVVILDAGHGTPDERNSLLTLKNNIDLLQKIKCFKHFIFFMLKRRLIYAKQRIW